MKEEVKKEVPVNITEEQKVHEMWYEEAKKQTIDSLPDFINHLMNDYNHDYGTICHALSAGAIATMWAMNGHQQGGITGFQAGAIMWELIRHWQKGENKTGLKLIDYDNMLFPQYKDHFEKTISADTWEALQKEAAKKIAESNVELVHPDVYDHWSAISSGKVPFGFKVKND